MQDKRTYLFGTLEAGVHIFGRDLWLLLNRGNPNKLEERLLLEG